MKLFKYIILSGIILSLCLPSLGVIFNLDNLNLSSRRTLTPSYLDIVRSSHVSINIESLLNSGLSDEEISVRIHNHLFLDWNDVVVNLSYISKNIDQISGEHTKVLTAFLTALLSDMRLQLMPGLADNLTDVAENLDTILELWEIDDRLSAFIFRLDAEPSNDIFFTRFMLNSLLRCLPGRVNREKFVSYIEEAEARGGAEISYTEAKDWGNIRHGQIAMTMVVSVAEVEKAVAFLESSGRIVSDGDVNIFSESDPSKLNLELADVSSNEIYSELTKMLNILQKPYRLQSVSALKPAYECWVSEVEGVIEMPFDERLDRLEYLVLGRTAIDSINDLIQIRRSLSEVILNDDYSEEIRVATLIFDRRVSCCILEQAISVAEYYKRRLDDSYAGRYEVTTQGQDEIILALSLFAESIVLDRYTVSRLWLYNNSNIGLNPFEINMQRDYRGEVVSFGQRLEREVVYLEHVINEMASSMHGELAGTSNIENWFNILVGERFQVFSQLYQEISEEHQNIFPNAESIWAHMYDVNIALSPLRAIESLKDSLKQMMYATYPQLQMDSRDLVDFLTHMRSYSYNLNVPREDILRGATLDVAEAADCLMVLSVLPYDENHNVLIMAKELEDNNLDIYYVITESEGMTFSCANIPLIKSFSSNGIRFDNEDIVAVRYGSATSRGIDLEGKTIMSPDASSDIFNFVGEGGIVGVISERGSGTAHLSVVLRGMGTPVLNASGLRFTSLIFDNMPLRILSGSVFPVLYNFREGDVAIVQRKRY
ncbi:MAG: hypothetical protein P9X27_02925 [Candidatus Kaelpia aquatica]|nr:hypothetical protein [Candidatus Kaelpia aquatica]